MSGIADMPTRRAAGGGKMKRSGLRLMHPIASPSDHYYHAIQCHGLGAHTLFLVSCSQDFSHDISTTIFCRHAICFLAIASNHVIALFFSAFNGDLVSWVIVAFIPNWHVHGNNESCQT